MADLYESFLYVTIYNGSDWTIEKMKIKLNLFYKDGTSDERVYAIHFLLPVEPLSNGSAREKVLLPGESERISRWTWEILTAYGRKRRDTLRMLPKTNEPWPKLGYTKGVLMRSAVWILILMLSSLLVACKEGTKPQNQSSLEASPMETASSWPWGRRCCLHVPRRRNLDKARFGRQRNPHRCRLRQRPFCGGGWFR